MSQHPITLTVNQSPHALTVPAHHTLLDVLRDDLGLTGTNEGCRMGDCGACTVLLKERRVPACLVLAVSADGMAVQTIEGLAGANSRHPLQAVREALTGNLCRCTGYPKIIEAILEVANGQ